MSVTLDIPPQLVERANTIAAFEGITLEALISRALEHLVQPPEQYPSSTLADPLSIFGRLRGTVLYIADDFNTPLEDFREYMA
jgi:hypothetical protein